MNRIMIEPITTRDFERALKELSESLGLNAINWKAKVSPPPYEREPVNETAKPSFRKRVNDILADIKQVIFNDPATIVMFSDGSKVCVKAANGDKFSKELGIVYAIVKRLYANDSGKSGYLRSKGLGDKIAKLVESGIDQKELNKKRKEAKLKKSLAKKDKAFAKVADEIAEQAAKEAIEDVYADGQKG